LFNVVVDIRYKPGFIAIKYLVALCSNMVYQLIQILGHRIRSIDNMPKIKDCKVKERKGQLKTNFVPKPLIFKVFF